MHSLHGAQDFRISESGLTKIKSSICSPCVEHILKQLFTPESESVKDIHHYSRHLHFGE